MSNVSAVKRIFSQRTMRAQTECKYRNLPEVLNKKIDRKRKEDYRTNRLMAEIFARVSMRTSDASSDSNVVVHFPYFQRKIVLCCEDAHVTILSPEIHLKQQIMNPGMNINTINGHHNLSSFQFPV